MTDDLAEVALHDDPAAIVEAAVQRSRALSGSDSAFAAARGTDGSGYSMSALAGILEPGFRDLVIRPGRGLGGQVISECKARTVGDYLAEPSITADYRPVVAREGLHGIACVPVLGPSGAEVLLYVSRHDRSAPGGVAVEAVERVASAASIGLYHVAARARERELAVLRERQALASDLHDSVAQLLFAIGVAAQHSREANDPSIVEEKLREIEATATQARAELRNTFARLSRTPDAVAFESVFEAELRIFERRTGRHVWITRHGEPRDLGQVAEDVLIASLREGLTNAAKHSARETVLAHLAFEARCVVLSVQTEVQTPELLAHQEVSLAPGSGLGILRDRTRRIGGGLELAIDDGVAVLRVEIPV